MKAHEGVYHLHSKTFLALASFVSYFQSYTENTDIVYYGNRLVASRELIPSARVLEGACNVIQYTRYAGQ